MKWKTGHASAKINGRQKKLLLLYISKSQAMKKEDENHFPKYFKKEMRKITKGQNKIDKELLNEKELEAIGLFYRVRNEVGTEIEGV